MYLIFHLLISVIIIFFSRFISNGRYGLSINILGDSRLADISSLSLSTISIFRGFFTDGNLESIISYNFLKANKEGNAYGFMKGVFKRYGIIFFIATILFNCFIPFFGKFFYCLNASDSLLFNKLSFFISPTIILMFFSSVLSAIINSQNRLFESTMAIFFGNVSFLAILLLCGFDFPFISIIIGNILYSLIPCIIMLFREKNFIKEKSMNVNLDQDILKSSLGQIFLSASHLIINKILIAMPLGSICYYDYGYKIIFSIAQIITEPIIKIINIEISHIFLENRMQEKIWDYVLLLMIFVMPFVFFIYNLSLDSFLKLPKIIFGNRLKHPEFLYASLKAFCPLLIIASLNKILSSILLINKKQQIVSMSNIFFSIINVIFSILCRNYSFIYLVYIYIIGKIMQMFILFFFIMYYKILKIKKEFCFFLGLLLLCFKVCAYNIYFGCFLYCILSLPYISLLFKKTKLHIKKNKS